ncbi:MAG: Mov34/MPN/PAD-1 family protein [Ktedonobacteraceae bacterium]|nr:Mov34/MPN/PAD-1 family protein [Ktedonobacteraceae bacterium]
MHALVTLSANAYDMLLKDIYDRRHIEACGLLLGTNDEQGNCYIEQVVSLHNIWNSPTYFEFAPEDLLAVDLDHPGRIVGVYHSHPTGLAAASSTDRKNMKRINQDQQIPWVWLIVSGPFDDKPNEKGRDGTPPTIIAYYSSEEELKQLFLCFENAQDSRVEG